MADRYVSQYDGDIWVARIPLTNGKYKGKRFNPKKYNNPKSAAILWRDKMGREEWGSRRWDYILAGHYKKMISKIGGVSVKLINCGDSWQTWKVSWREFGKDKSKHFGPSRHGDLEKAEIAANEFAAKVRADITGGELNLPMIEFDL